MRASSTALTKSGNHGISTSTPRRPEPSGRRICLKVLPASRDDGANWVVLTRHWAGWSTPSNHGASGCHGRDDGAVAGVRRTPLIGRAEELSQLGDALSSARRGQPVAVLIS